MRSCCWLYATVAVALAGVRQLGVAQTCYLLALPMMRRRHGQSNDRWRGQRRGLLPCVPGSRTVGLVSIHIGALHTNGLHFQLLQHCAYLPPHSVDPLPLQQCLQLVPSKCDMQLSGLQLSHDTAATTM